MGSVLMTLSDCMIDCSRAVYVVEYMMSSTLIVIGLFPFAQIECNVKFTLSSSRWCVVHFETKEI